MFLGGDPADPVSWRPSAEVNGNPGTSDSTIFNGDPHGDDDGNGLSNLAQYALGGPNGSPRVSLTERNGDSFVSFRHQQVIGADDILITPELSSDLITWVAAAPEEFQLVDEILVAPGIIERHYESASPGVLAREFLRLRIGLK